MDIESENMDLLVATASNMGLSAIERLHAGKALSSYQGRPGVSDKAQKLKAQVEIELSAAQSNDQREFALMMKKLLASI